jgi:hypothetical protein
LPICHGHFYRFFRGHFCRFFTDILPISRIHFCRLLRTFAAFFEPCCQIFTNIFADFLQAFLPILRTFAGSLQTLL